jgi:hypothetical protein
MSQFLLTLENSAFGAWVRESPSLFAYPMILFFHTVGLGFVVGISTAIALRMLGVARRMPLAPMEHFYWLLWLGFWVNAVSGTMLLIADATTKFANVVFFIKMGFVALSMVTMAMIRRQVFHDPALDIKPISRSGKILAVAALVFWTGAITAGRLMAYLGPVSGAPGLTNHLAR